MHRTRAQHVTIVASIFVIALGMSSIALADEHIHGVITGRGTDSAVMVRSDDASDMAVVLTENTKVRQTSGIRSRKVGAPSLIPGLRVDIEGKHETGARFIADRISFSKSNFKMALAIQAGVTPTNQAVATNRELIEANQQQNAQRLNQHQESLEQQDRKIAATDEKIVATSGSLEARIASLDDYSVLDTVTVYFRNGRSALSRDYEAQLQQLAQKAKGIDGYSVQVEGFASAVGREALNQRLSQERAVAVAAILQQNGIPSTKMLFPAAMGTSQQVASNTTQNGQAENRRAVVRLLQNRGITGK